MTVAPELLLEAYRAGVFPMAEHRNDPEVFWVDPQHRGILPLDGLHMSRSLVRRLKKGGYSVDIDAEVIDVQSLLPFDINHDIVKSIAKTNRVMVIDEDVPGGASAYILNEILNTQNAFQYLDSEPKTLTAKAHRPAYGDDGDYFSKPSAEDIFEAVYEVMHESNPEGYPKLR